MDLASLYTIMNKTCEDEHCPGFVMVDKNGVIKHFNESCQYFLDKKEQLDMDENIASIPLKAYFCPHKKHQLNSIEINDDRFFDVDREKDSRLAGMSLLEQLGEKVISEPEWNHNTEKLVKQISLRYAHEVLNALTPVNGIIQMLRNDSNKKLSEKEIELLDLAQQELIKGKNYVNDFMTINFESTPKPTWLSIEEIKDYIELELETQNPEFMSHLQFGVVGKLGDLVFIDKKQLRLVLHLVLKKWLDYASCPSVIAVDFISSEPNEFSIHLQMFGEEDPLMEIDDEFKFYLHLINQNVKRNHGVMSINHGITLTYRNEESINMEKN